MDQICPTGLEFDTWSTWFYSKLQTKLLPKSKVNYTKSPNVDNERHQWLNSAPLHVFLKKMDTSDTDNVLLSLSVVYSELEKLKAWTKEYIMERPESIRQHSISVKRFPWKVQFILKVNHLGIAISLSVIREAAGSRITNLRLNLNLNIYKHPVTKKNG